MKQDEFILALILGAIFIGIPVIAIVLANRPLGAVPTGSYNNEERWEVVEDANGNIKEVIVHRNAVRS
jgi:hypothetical protein